MRQKRESRDGRLRASLAIIPVNIPIPVPPCCQALREFPRAMRVCDFSFAEPRWCRRRRVSAAALSGFHFSEVPAFATSRSLQKLRPAGSATCTSMLLFPVTDLQPD
jgi:hypothetical protein